MSSNQKSQDKEPPQRDAHSRQRQFTIPVFPHVRKFIVKNYPAQGGVIIVEEYNILSKLITLALRKPTSPEHNNQYRDRLTATITVRLSAHQARLSPRLGKLMRINIDADRLFKDHLIAWIEALRGAGVPPFTACRMFLEHYNIEDEEYAQRSAHQYYLRKVKK